MGDTRESYKILVGKPKAKRLFGRYRAQNQGVISEKFPTGTAI